MFIKCIPLTVLSTLMIACTHIPSIGDKILAQSNSTKQMGTQWNHGEKHVTEANNLTKKGTSLIKKGNKNISSGNKMVSNGEKQVSSGKKLMNEGHNKMMKGETEKSESEQQFKKAFPGKMEKF